MKVLFDINHPAHIHFFKNPAQILINTGIDVVFTSRDKDVTLDIFKGLNIKNTKLNSKTGTGPFSLGLELISRNWELYKFVKKEKPDVMCAIGGTFVSHVGKLTGTPSLVFYDTENAKLQNIITYPFATKIFVPNCYKAWTPNNSERYSGYHELSYLHPNYFRPNLNIAINSGLVKDKKNIFFRLVSWTANHDIAETGWSLDTLKSLVNTFQDKYNLIISSERTLPTELQSFAYKGPKADIHHLLAYCNLYVGESATMASESAILGVPAIYAAETGRGYTDEQEDKYSLVRNLREINKNALIKTIRSLISEPENKFKEYRLNLLNDTVDVAEYVSQQILMYRK